MSLNSRHDYVSCTHVAVVLYYPFTSFYSFILLLIRDSLYSVYYNLYSLFYSPYYCLLSILYSILYSIILFVNKTSPTLH